MKRLKVICIIVLLTALTGCSWWSKNQPEKTADELAADAQMYFENEKYDQAVKSYKKLKDWYPFSVHAREAGLKIADAYYLMESYDEAILAYNEYERMHPNDEKIPYVIYQMGICDFDRIETIDRDATATQNALQTFQRLVEQFPDSEYAAKAEPLIETCLKNLAAKEMYIGRFYFKAEKYAAALNRFDNVLIRYPDFEGRQQALDYMAKCRERMRLEEKREMADAEAAAAIAAEGKKTEKEDTPSEINRLDPADFFY